MQVEIFLRWAHVVGTAVLLGTGVGIAFFMTMAVRSGEARIVAAVSRMAVVADFVFIAAAVAVQPLTGIALARALDWPLSEGWIMLSLALYLLAGALWLPLVLVHIRLRDIAEAAAARGAALGKDFHHLYRIWFAMGVPAFAAVLAIIWVMLARPSFSL